MTKNEMSYLTSYFTKIVSNLIEMTEKIKKYLRNVETNVILYMNIRYADENPMFNIGCKGAGNYAL